MCKNLLLTESKRFQKEYAVFQVSNRPFDCRHAADQTMELLNLQDSRPKSHPTVRSSILRQPGILTLLVPPPPFCSPSINLSLSTNGHHNQLLIKGALYGSVEENCSLSRSLACGTANISDQMRTAMSSTHSVQSRALDNAAHWCE